MKEIQIRCDTEGRIAIDEMHRIEGIDVVLVNEKDIPLNESRSTGTHPQLLLR